MVSENTLIFHCFLFLVLFSGAFRVDAITGVVTVSGEVNKEDQTLYYIKIRAGAKNCGIKTNDTNTGEGGNKRPDKFITATVWIDVIDVNDNAPRFLNGQDKLYYEKVEQKHIITLNTIDKDEGSGGEVCILIFKKSICDGVSIMSLFVTFVTFLS